jgi:protein ImuA
MSPSVPPSAVISAEVVSSGEAAVDLQQLLQRQDIWRGCTGELLSALAQPVDTGWAALNAGLRQGGWPRSNLIEVCQQNLNHGEWQLMTPALLRLSSGFIVLLNPPAMPFVQGLLQAGLDLDRIIIVQAAAKADFLASFYELARAQACDAVLGWQPKQALSYAELRKCQLAAADGAGLYILFRPASMRSQSSPASLRLWLESGATALQVTLFKQKGMLQTHDAKPIALPLPELWQGLLPHRLLDQPFKRKTRKPVVTPLRRGKS